jgi:hypothetical protein
MHRDMSSEDRRNAELATPQAKAPATGTADPSRTEMAPGEEPVTTGTLFLTMIILMIIGAVWVIMYAMLLDR